MPTTIYKLLWLIVGGGFLVVIDQVIKRQIWGLQSAVEVGVPEYITWHQNHGISFGIELPYYLSVSLMALFILALIVWLWRTPWWARLLTAGLVLSIAGGLSNLIDRISLGFVRDFLAPVDWLPIFNLADIFVVIGVALIMMSVYRHEHRSV